MRQNSFKSLAFHKTYPFMKVNFHWLAFDWPKRQKNNINIFALAELSHRARPSPFLAVYFFCGFEKNRFTFFSL